MPQSEKLCRSSYFEKGLEMGCVLGLNGCVGLLESGACCQLGMHESKCDRVRGEHVTSAMRSGGVVARSLSRANSGASSVSSARSARSQPRRPPQQAKTDVDRLFPRVNRKFACSSRHTPKRRSEDVVQVLVT